MFGLVMCNRILEISRIQGIRFLEFPLERSDVIHNLNVEIARSQSAFELLKCFGFCDVSRVGSDAQQDQSQQ